MRLYDYLRSTASYRVRLALSFKNINAEIKEIHLINNNGEQHTLEYAAINPQELLPSLQINDQILTQSLAIIEYLEETQPEPPLLPKDPLARAQIRAIAQIIACDIHPLNNLRTLNYLRCELSASEDQITNWYHNWLKKGFDAIETLLSKVPRASSVCFGDSISMADICLIPQVYNANRFKFKMNDYPIINEINDHCLQFDSFKKASKGLLNLDFSHLGQYTHRK